MSAIVQQCIFRADLPLYGCLHHATVPSRRKLGGRLQLEASFGHLYLCSVPVAPLPAPISSQAYKRRGTSLESSEDQPEARKQHI
jgi:hypothetical protein